VETEFLLFHSGLSNGARSGNGEADWRELHEFTVRAGVLHSKTEMIRAKYRGYSICQQKEFGPLKLLKWVEGGDLIVVRTTPTRCRVRHFGR
jgi:hypothetical protein